MSPVDTRKPVYAATIDGQAVHVVDCSVDLSRYTRADSGVLTVPREQAAGLEPYTAVHVEMGYAHGGPSGTFDFFVDTSGIRDGRIPLKDRWLTLGDERQKMVRTFTNVTFEDLVSSITVESGIPLDLGGVWVTRKSKYHIYKATRRRVIEAACRDWEISPLIFFDCDGRMYLGKDRAPSTIETYFGYGQSITGHPEAGERRLRLDYIERSEKDQLKKEGRLTRKRRTRARAKTVEERVDEKNNEVVIPYWRLPVLFAPWIWHGDVVWIDHPDLSGEFLVAAARHKARPAGTVLEVEALE